VERTFGVGFLLMDVLFTPGFGVSGLLIDGATQAWYSLPPVIAVDFTAPLPEEDEAQDTVAASTAPEA
jgi:hypothetical protein